MGGALSLFDRSATGHHFKPMINPAQPNNLTVIQLERDPAKTQNHFLNISIIVIAVI